MICIFMSMGGRHGYIYVCKHIEVGGVVERHRAEALVEVGVRDAVLIVVEVGLRAQHALRAVDEDGLEERAHGHHGEGRVGVAEGVVPMFGVFYVCG